MATTRQPVRFSAPLERGGWIVRALTAAVLTAACLPLAIYADGRGSVAAVALALAGAAGFARAAVRSARRALARRPPLVIDEHGVHVDTGPGRRWNVAWNDVVRVRLDDGVFTRRVVLELADRSGARVIPSCCHGGLPPEWLAGLIETFRECGGRLDELTRAA